MTNNNNLANSSQLFCEANKGSAIATETLLQHYAPYIKKVIQQVQPLNSTANLTSDQLHAIGIATLQQLLQTTNEERFNRFFAWNLKQAMLKAIQQ